MTIKVTYNVTDIYVSETVSATYINVSYETPSGGGAWGTITGTLSNQLDLQAALDAKFDDPTGTTSQYLRGDGSLATFPTITSGTVTSVGLSMPSAFTVSGSPITSSGTLAVTATGDTTQYIAGDGSLVAFPISGQAGTLVREVRNNTGATLTKGTVVYINGALGNRPTVAKALATGDSTSAQTFGLLQADISNNSNGYLVAFGDLDGLNTSAFTEGVQLYLSGTTAGTYTSTKPYAPIHMVYVGVVTRSHPTLGRIEVRIQNGFEMDELHNVDALNPNNNDGLFWNTSTNLWEHKQIATVLGYTPQSALTLSTTGTSGASTLVGATLNIPQYQAVLTNPITGTGVDGQVAYFTGASTQAGSNNLFWDNANARLGIGTNTPNSNFQIGSNIAGTAQNKFISVNDTTTTDFSNGAFFNSNIATTRIGLILSNTSSGNWINNFISILATGASHIGNNYFTNISGKTTDAGYSMIINQGNQSNGLLIGTANEDPIYFGTNNTARVAITANGRLLLGSTSEGTQTLQVTGTSLFTGASTFGADMSYSRSTNAINSLNVINTTDGTDSQSRLYLQAGAGATVLGQRSNLSTDYKILGVNDGYLFKASLGDIAILNDVATGRIKFAAGASSTAQMTLTADGNLLLGTTTNGTQRLQVTGDTLLRGSGATSATTALTVQNSGSANILRVLNDGQIVFGPNSNSFFSSDKATLGASLSGAGVTFYDGSQTTGTYFRITGNNITDTGGASFALRVQRNFVPPSANGTFVALGVESTINQTGGANGITRGLYINPTLTAAADWRSIEWSNNSGWGLYGVGTCQNFLAGNLGIGTTTINNSALRVNKAITGAVTQSSIANSSTINSDVTLNAWMYVSSPSTQSAAFTVGEVVHFNAFNLTIGAGSAVTNHIGFRANALLTAGTNVWGFYGDIPSGTGRWNLYMNGTAANFLSGDTQIGTGSFTSEKLQVNGTMKVTGASTFSSSVQAGGGTTNASAILQADSTTKGFLPPRMSTAQKIAITSPATGLQVYDTTLNQNAFYNGTAWVSGGVGGIVNFVVQHASIAAYADSTTYYFGGTPTVPSTAAGVQRGIFNKAGIAKSVYLILRSSTTPSTEAITLTLFKATGAGALSSVATTTFSWNGTNNFVAVNWTGLSVSVAVGESYELSVAIPLMATNPTAIFLAGNIEVEY